MQKNGIFFKLTKLYLLLKNRLMASLKIMLRTGLNIPTVPWLLAITRYAKQITLENAFESTKLSTTCPNIRYVTRCCPTRSFACEGVSIVKGTKLSFYPAHRFSPLLSIGRHHFTPIKKELCQRRSFLFHSL